MGKGKDPAFLFYSSDFLVGTLRMSFEQKGKYIYLLCLQHDNEDFITQDDIDSVLTERDNVVLSKFEKDKDGTYYNKRLRDESEKRKAYSESRRNNRKGSKQDMSNICQTYDEHMVNRNKDIDLDKDLSIKKDFKIPNIDEVKAYCKERNNDVDADKWFNFYQAKGWMVGKNKMKDWKAAVRTWENKKSEPEQKLKGITYV